MYSLKKYSLTSHVRIIEINFKILCTQERITMTQIGRKPKNPREFVGILWWLAISKTSVCKAIDIQTDFR